MEVVKLKTQRLQTIEVAWEVLPVEWTGVPLYEVTYDDWSKEESTKRNFEALVEYWEEKKMDFIKQCDEEVLKNKEILAKIEVL